MSQGYELTEQGAKTLDEMIEETGGYPCSVDGKICPCGSWSEDCR